MREIFEIASTTWALRHSLHAHCQIATTLTTSETRASMARIRSQLRRPATPRKAPHLPRNVQVITGHSRSFGLKPGTGSSLGCATLPTERQIRTLRPTATVGNTISQPKLVGERLCQSKSPTSLMSIAINALFASCQNGNIDPPSAFD